MNRLDTAAYRASYDHAQHQYRIATGGQRKAAWKNFVRQTAAKLEDEIAGVPRPKRHRK